MLESLSVGLFDWLGEDVRSSFAYITNGIPGHVFAIGNIGKHMAWYASVRFTLIAAIASATFAVLFGLLGAGLKQSAFPPFRWMGNIYTTMVRGIPDILFILFFPLAFEQAVEYFLARANCGAEVIAAATSWPPCAPKYSARASPA